MPNTDQKVAKDRYMIIPRTLIFVRRGEYFLLIKGKPDKRLWANKYNGIGGHIEQGEDIHSAAERELLEETGLCLEINLIGIVTVDVEKEIGVGIFVFLGDYTEGKLISSSEGNLEWIHVNDLNRFPLVEDVHIFLNRILYMERRDPPFIAHSKYDKKNKLVVIFKN